MPVAMTLELSGVLILALTFVVHSVGVVWWASKMTQKLADHEDNFTEQSKEIAKLFELNSINKDKIAANEEAALNREIVRLNVENRRLREADSRKGG